MSRYDLYRYLIVDDEQHCIDVLKYELQQCGVRESLIYSASSGEEASEYIELVKPDLVFLDIDMPRIDGFQLLEKAENIKHFIVTTAYEKYAIQAIKAHAINYILKPVNHSELKSALSHFHDICNMPLNASSSIVQQQLSYMNSKKFDSIVVSGQNVLHICKLEEICALSAENTYTVIHLKDNKQIVSSKNLGHYDLFNPRCYMDSSHL